MQAREAPLDVEVAIVGGGPAGLATALFVRELEPELAKGLIVLEREQYPREKICAGAVGARALRLLSLIGARPEVPHVTIRAIEARTRYGSVRAEHEDAGWVIRRREFDAALAATVQARGIELRTREKLVGLHTLADGRVELVCESGLRVRARAVVGADGVGSYVRRAAGFTQGELRAQAIEIDCRPLAGELREGTVLFDLSDASLPGYAWKFPTPLGGETMVSHGIYAVKSQALRGTSGAGRAGKEAGPGVGCTLKESLLQRTAGHQALGPWRRYAERGIAPGAVLGKGPILLVGEAAGIDPVLGEGIAQAIEYGLWAARILSAGSRRGRFDFDGVGLGQLDGSLGFDLRVRSRVLELVYGAGRPLSERLVARSPALAHAGLSYFAGRSIARSELARASFDLALAGFGALRETALRR